MKYRYALTALIAGTLLSGWLLAQTATRPMAAARAATATPAPVTSPAQTAAANTPATTSVQVSVLSSGDDSDSLMQGNLLYDHLGDPDPFYPTKLDCNNPKYRAEHIRQCPPGGGAQKTGCAKFKLEELQLTGVTNTLGINVAMLSAENKPYFVKIGDQCGDAKVLEIDPKTTCVKWRQDIPQDQNSLRPYKDVYRCLRGLPPELATSSGK